MKSYEIRIVEVLHKDVTVQADSLDNAMYAVEKAYGSAEYVLDSCDFNHMYLLPLTEEN